MESFKPKRLNNSTTKTILIWNSCFDSPYCDLGNGIESFLKYDCRVYDCFVTKDRNLLPIDQFDAIIFHGPEFYSTIPLNYPFKRSEKQSYVYFSLETPIKYPVSHNLDNFFNLTMTYRFDSDIPRFYFEMVDMNGVRVSPDNNPSWVQTDFSDENLINLRSIRATKNKPIAWFVSNCKSDNGREDYAKALQEYIPVDIYGKCGQFDCSKSDDDDCLKILKKDYYFYLSFENANCVDYVTEKVPKAMKNDVVPIVFGGANYTKYFPPNSYIDASSMTPDKLAMEIYSIISSEKRYIEYFWWKNYYKLQDVGRSTCRLCELLHNDTRPKKSYEIVDWWAGTKVFPFCELKS